MLRKFAALLLTPAVLAVVAFWGSAATAAGSDASSFVAKANAERSSRGLRPYTVASDLAAVARRHSERMAAKQSLYHNPNLGSEVSGWQVVGENVGSGGSVDSIHQALMDSPAHRANILAKDYTQIGVGTVTDANGVIWVTQVFRLPTAAPVVAAPSRPRVVVAARTTTRSPSRTLPKAVVKPARVVAAPVAPESVDSAALMGALAATAASDPFGQALVYVDTMAGIAG